MGSQRTRAQREQSSGSHTDADPANASAIAYDGGIEAEVRQATSRYVEQHEEWFHDQEGRRSDKEEMSKVISDWERQHGPLTPQEKAKARSLLGL